MESQFSSENTRMPDQGRDPQKITVSWPSENIYRMLVDNSLVGVMVVQDGKMVFGSPILSKIIGYSVEEMILMPQEKFIELIHPEDRSIILKNMADRAANREAPLRYELRIIDKGGNIRWIELAPSKIEFDGRPASQTPVIDITDRKIAEQRLRHSEERYRTVIESQTDLIARALPDGTITFVNEAYCQYYGQESEELIGTKYFIHMPAEDWEVEKEYLKTFSAKNPVRTIEHKAVDKNGTSRLQHWTDRAIFDDNNNIIEFQFVGRDITEQKQAEETLKKSEEEKDRFIAMMSHELRNPLTPIMTGAQLLRSQIEKKIAEGAVIDRFFDEATEIIEQQSKNMAHLLDDLLDISRVSQGKIKLNKKPVNLVDCLQNSVKATQSFMDLQKHTLFVNLPEHPIYIEADPLRIEQIIINLLKNAIKFTPRGGNVWLTARSTDGEAEILVKDSGVGIEPDKIKSIFNLFTSYGTPFVTTLGELGIGLKLAKDLILMHGGTITPKSAGVNQGSEFIMRLPVLSEGYKPTAVDNEIPSAATNKLRVLIVDDNTSITKLMANALSYFGHDAQEAHDGLSALALVKDYRPHIILIDIGLPVMNGYELAQELRKIEKEIGHKIKLIAITGYGQDDDKKRALEAGFDLHLTKPVDLKTLEKAVADI